MLKITSKEFEIEEPIQLTKMIDGKEENLYEFTMQLTSDDLQKLKKIVFDTSEENKEKNHENFLDICLKEHKEDLKKTAGEYKFAELIEELQGFIMGFFIEKRMKPMNTQIINLTKIMNNLQQFK